MIIDTMLKAAIAASDVILEVYAKPFAAESKADGSPVTEADSRAEAIILDFLEPLGIPVLGVVLAPVTGDIFWTGPKGAMAGRVADGAVTEARPIAVSDALPLRIVASRSHGHAALAALCDTLKVAEDVSVGSSLKFCLLAEGKAQLYPRFTPTSEWDTAAGQAVLEAAGGVVLNLDGTPLSCGHPDRKFLNGFFVAAASADLAHRALAEMRGLLL